MKLLPFSVQTFNTSLAVHVAAQSPAVSRGHDPWVHLMQPLQRVQHVISGLGKGEVSQFAEWNGASGLSSASCTDLQPTFSYTASTWHLWHPLSMMPYTLIPGNFWDPVAWINLNLHFPHWQHSLVTEFITITIWFLTFRILILYFPLSSLYILLWAFYSFSLFSWIWSFELYISKGSQDTQSPLLPPETTVSTWRTDIFSFSSYFLCCIEYSSLAMKKIF